jgi:sulfur carrier protein ThiS adenylyltransferase
MPIPQGFTPSASQAQLEARRTAFATPPNPLAMVSESEVRDALTERHSAATQAKLDAAHVAIAGLGGLGSTIAGGAHPHRRGGTCTWSISTAST